MLNGFEFNINGKLSATLYAQYGVDFDRAAGSVSIDLIDFVPANVIAAPSGATHMKLVAGVGEVNLGRIPPTVSSKRIATSSPRKLQSCCKTVSILSSASLLISLKTALLSGSRHRNLRTSCNAKSQQWPGSQSAANSAGN